MFGSGKKTGRVEILHMQEALKQGKALARKLTSRREAVASGFAEAGASMEQMEADARQASENALRTLEYARQNSAAVTAVLQGLEECRGDTERVRQDYETICGQIKKQVETCRQTVEKNKHVTSPSKALSGLPEKLHGQNRDYFAQLDEMADYGKQMGVLALNAAIEAGRMGESGRSFVSAAESIRAFSKQYDVSVRLLREKIEASDRRLGELENTVHRMVGLLKENSVAAAKLMRDAQATEKAVEEAAGKDFSKELSSMREELMGLRNSEEEIIKAQERNRIQMDDILEEIRTRRKNGEEIESEWKKFCDDADAWRESLK